MDERLKTLLDKLSKPYWTPQDPRIRIPNLTVDHIGQLNLMWALTGRRPIAKGFFDGHMESWELAGRICSASFLNIPIREYLTLFTEAEFYAFVLQNKRFFAAYMSMPAWHKTFKLVAPGRGYHA